MGSVLRTASEVKEAEGYFRELFNSESERLAKLQTEMLRKMSAAERGRREKILAEPYTPIEYKGKFAWKNAEAALKAMAGVPFKWPPDEPGHPDNSVVEPEPSAFDRALRAFQT
jgi:hypothetical protein